MNPRERYLATMLFQHPDRVPFSPGCPRESTLKRWHADGLVPNADWFHVLCGEIGVVPQGTQPVLLAEIDFRMNPQFEEKVIERRNGSLIVQDWKGNICEISDQFDVSYLRSAKDFVTRSWIKCPVETPEDFERMKLRYRPDDPLRYPPDFNDRVRQMRHRDYPAAISVAGPFWQLREWCGFEALCMMFIEAPEFVREMISFWTRFVSATMARLLDAGVLDAVCINEDMAYKEKSMISPAMARESLLPTWRRWTAELRQAGVQVVSVDSDGRIDELIPLWIEAGVNACEPIEVAAGCDINAYRRAFGRRMAYGGGVDKRCMAKGGKAIEDELARIAPVVRDGGCIPSCDHGVPPDVSWPDFVHYGRLLAQLTGWL